MFASFLQASFVFLLKENLLDAYWILHCVVYSMQPVRVLLGCSAFVSQALESFYERFDPDFINIRTKAREVLQREDDLNEIVQVCFLISKISSSGSLRS